MREIKWKVEKKYNNKTEWVTVKSQMNADSFLLTWILFGQKQHGKRKSFWALRKVWGFLLYNMIILDKQYFLHNKGKFESFKPFQLNLQMSANTLFSIDRGDPRCMVVRCACAVRLLGFRVMGGAESSSHCWRIFPWSYQDAAVRSGAGSFQHPLTTPHHHHHNSPVSRAFCTFLCLSLSVSFQICFWKAVHLSARCSNWPPTPTVKAHRRYPFNPVAMEHLWYRRANPDE